MAGIAGFIIKARKFETEFYKKAILAMLKSLSKSDKQLSDFYCDNEVALGNSVPVSQKNNSSFIEVNPLHILCVIEGLVFIDTDKCELIVRKYGLKNSLSDNQLIPYLFHHFGTDIVKCITGDYNIFIYNRKDKEAALFNSKLGTLPMYCYESNSILLFASKIESILASGILPRIEFDAITIAEHLIFNYAVSENSYIQNIETLKNATLIQFKNNRFKQIKYWKVDQLFGVNVVGEKESLQLINSSIRNALEKITTRYNRINLSLTGGWDSRVILSYLINDSRDKLQLYSFGAENSSDITVPQFISEKEGLNYIPHILDEDYLKNIFITKAKETIRLSNGSRNYKRTHYLHSIEQIASNSEIFISGIFGDEVFKVNKPSGGSVLSKNAVSLIENNFKSKEIISHFFNSGLSGYLNIEQKKIRDGLSSRLEEMRKEMNYFETSGQKYFSFRFEKNLRKYFGAEINSYNDFGISYSPFIDDDFLKSFARTKYFGARYSFNSNNIRLKRQSSMLYYKLTRENYPALTLYPSSRGFSMKDVNTVSGNLSIILHKFLLKKNKNTDGFNTRYTDQIFHDAIVNEPKLQSMLNLAKPEACKAQEINSLAFWMNSISMKY